MRFHCGLSFSWHSIKKILIPILLGFLAFVGFNYMQDNKIVPLGIIQANALEIDPIPDEIEDSYYYYSYIMAQDNEEVEHKSLYNKIYWFDNSDTSYGVLCNIYILLFLYCISMTILRGLTIIKNIRW